MLKFIIVQSALKNEPGTFQCAVDVVLLTVELQIVLVYMYVIDNFQ